jgi:putrescine importer
MSDNQLAMGETVVLKRQLGLLACVLYGMAILLPIAPVPIYGFLTELSGGHMALAYVLACIPMAFSAWSYGQMGAEFPYAGASYTFVSRCISPHLGFLTGWIIQLDYILFPLLNYIVLGLYTNSLFPALSAKSIIIFSIILICIINCLGIKSLATINNILTIFGFLVAFYFIYAAIAVLQGGGVGTGFSSVAFVNPETFNWGAVITGASIACFSFIGFDIMTTLAEETIEPKKNLPRATLIVCFAMAFLFAVMSYLAQAVFPDYTAFTNPDVAFVEVAVLAGGETLSKAISLAMVAGAFAFSMDMMAAATRMLFGMGRDGVLPKKVFGYVHPKTGAPVYNVILVSIIALIGSGIALGDLIPLINFGGLFAYILVNLSCILHFFGKERKRTGWDIFKYLIVPGLGFLTVLTLWLMLPGNAKLIGSVWGVLGIIYMAILTKGFKNPMVELKG